MKVPLPEMRKAIAAHSTDTTDVAWDGPANKARLRLDESQSYYRSAFAWQDPEGDPKTKAAYKFIHHMVASNGDIGAANTRAASQGIAVLNGGRGGANIPDSDRKGVWNHLARHLEDAGAEPPELKSEENKSMERELRSMACELRVISDVSADGSGPGPKTVKRFEGYAAVFDALSLDLGGFRERIAPGAFADSIKTGDVRALFNHNPDKVLGRTSSNTLSLMEDGQGLRISITPPDTQYAKDLISIVERGDVNQMSFGFYTISDRWNKQGGEWIRTLLAVDLIDVSPVTFPAYPQTNIAMRGLQQAIREEEMRKLEASMYYRQRKMDLLKRL